MLKTDMYILGFILIFAGLALMLYYFVLRFAGAPTVSTSPVEPMAARSAAVPDASPVTVTAQPVREFAASSEDDDAPIVSHPKKQKEAPAPQPPAPTERETVRVVDTSPAIELYATGYLYTDASGKMALLEHPERIEGELTASMKRLGPATLRFRKDAYYFDHGDGLLVIPERKMREVRFSDGGTVFVPGSSDLPLVYFFTVDTQTIREFLSSRS